jgi:hypothetical protein
MDRDRLLRDLRWLAEGNPRYAGTDEEGRQNPELATLMAEDLLLSYIGDGRLLRSSTRYAGGIRPGGSVCWVGSGACPDPRRTNAVVACQRHDTKPL